MSAFGPDFSSRKHTTRWDPFAYGGQCQQAVAHGRVRIILWNEIEILWKRQDDRHLEEARRCGLDDYGTFCVKELPDLLLSLEGDWPEGRIGPGHETVWVFWQRWVRRKREVMSVERDTVRQVSCADNRRGVRVGGLLVALRELVDDRLGGHACQRGFPQIGRVRDRIASAPDPLYVLHNVLYRHRARHAIDHWRLDVVA